MSPAKRLRDPECHGCLVGRIHGQTRCVYCGTAIKQGREPNDRERFETSQEARELRDRQIADARRTPDEIDSIVRAAIAAHIDPTGEFTYDHLIQFTGLNTCSLKFSLQRLEAKGVVKQTGLEFIRSNRTRSKWQYLMPIIPVAKIGRREQAPANARKATSTAN